MASAMPARAQVGNSCCFSEKLLAAVCSLCYYGAMLLLELLEDCLYWLVETLIVWGAFAALGIVLLWQLTLVALWVKKKLWPDKPPPPNAVQKALARIEKEIEERRKSP